MLLQKVSLYFKPPLYVCVCVLWGCDRLPHLTLKAFINKSPLIFFFSVQASLLLHLPLPISSEQFWHAHCTEPLRALSLSPVFPIMHCCRRFFQKTPLNFLSCIGSAVNLVGAVNQHIRNWLCFYATTLITPEAKWAVHARHRAVHFVVGVFFFFPSLDW